MRRPRRSCASTTDRTRDTASCRARRNRRAQAMTGRQSPRRRRGRLPWLSVGLSNTSSLPQSSNRVDIPDYGFMERNRGTFCPAWRAFRFCCAGRTPPQTPQWCRKVSSIRTLCMRWRSRRSRWRSDCGSPSVTGRRTGPRDVVRRFRPISGPARAFWLCTSQPRSFTGGVAYLRSGPLRAGWARHRRSKCRRYSKTCFPGWLARVMCRFGWRIQHGWSSWCWWWQGCLRDPTRARNNPPAKGGRARIHIS
jgi:hypothetical protein